MALTASSRRTLTAAFAVSILVGGFYALRLGQDINFDQRNYHFESVYQFLDGRLDVDAAPSGLLHSYFNPLPYLPFYEMARHWPPRLAIFTLGAWHGINFGLAFAIIYRLCSAQDPRRRAWQAAFGAMLSGAGAMTLSEVGSSDTDLLLSPLILLAVLLLVEGAYGRRWGSDLALAALASAIVGLAIGLKLTNAIYAAGLAFACLLGWDTWLQRLVSVVVCGLAGALGVAVSGGFWFVTLWRRYRSPVFPYYDSYFRSPEIDSVSVFHGQSVYDPRFLPKTFQDALTLPFRWMEAGHSTAELLFRDMRFGVLFALLPLGGALYIRRRTRRGAPAAALTLRGGEARVLVFFLTAYAVWLFQFGIQRYIVALELLLGPCLLIVLNRVLPEKWLPLAVAALALGGAATVLPPDWGHVKPHRDWYAVALPPVLQKPAIVLAPPGSSFIAPFLPPETFVIGFNGKWPPRRGGDGLVNRTLDSALARTPELPVVLLAPELVRTEARAALSRLGLDFAASCQVVPNAVAYLAACPLERGAVSPIAAPTLEAGKTLTFGSSREGAAALLSGWNPDTSWGNIGPGVSPKLIFRGDSAFVGQPIRLTFKLTGIGGLGSADDLALQVGSELVATWPANGMGSDLTACVPAGLLPSSEPTEFAFVDRQHGEPSPTRPLGSLGLASLTANIGGCQPATPTP